MDNEPSNYHDYTGGFMFSEDGIRWSQIQEAIRLLNRAKSVDAAQEHLTWAIPLAIVLVPVLIWLGLDWLYGRAWTMEDRAALRFLNSSTVRIGLSGVLLPMMSFAGVLFALRQMSYKHALRGLQEVGDNVRLAGPLAESLHVKHRDLRAKVEETLTRMLGLLREEDADLLTRKQRESLHRALFGKNEDLAVVILQALAEIGDVSALPSVQRLAQGRESSLPVREAAEGCEKVLQVRLEAARSRERLLRPAGPAVEPAGTLLRPAITTNQTPAEQLLRPAGPGTRDEE